MGGVEMLGYLAMAAVGVSIAMKKIHYLRIWNLTGAVLFTIYGYLIESNPVMILNIILTLLNIYYLVQMAKSKDKAD
ncbi:lactate dehydrogenase [bacterium]|nr:lactate dehydrogenase [bacterium]MDG1518584.1 uroporphyrinogen decarboxylase [Flavobacteriales bacterium]|tara:strand:+ start:706 stop:936 length:231 start_codon:yes stop_codon:yes gene_type:complete